jgi:eukaryotic-like serine/threonine-protein kinase
MSAATRPVGKAATANVAGSPGPHVSVGQHSIAGAKARNDDSFGMIVPDAALLASHGIAMAIADGMSSSEGAKEASENCVKSFLGDYYCTHASWSVKKSVGVVLRATNSWLYAQGQRQHDSERGMVSTFSGVVLKAGTAHIFHVGDTRISRFHAGRLEALTRDHRVNLGRGQEQLSRAFGIGQNIEVDYRAEPLEAGDVLIFTTDGVHDMIAPAEIVALLKTHAADLTTAATAIVQRAFKSGSTDNLTCQLVRIDAPGRLDAAGHLQSLTALPFPPELAPGMTFEGYEIIRELHTSKRTQVYLARDKASGESVVLKTPSVNFEDEPAYIEMFSREEWIGKLVANPNVVRVLSPERGRRHLFVVTEYFDGQTLRQWMRDHPKPDLESVRSIIDQIAKGLRAFHRKEVIHQDLKPENIMIDGRGTVKIIDFGSARSAGLEEMATSVEKPHLVGTLDYTAPEYHLGERPNNRSDIYAVGVLAYELLTGRLPYGRGFANAKDAQRLDYQSARSVRDDIPIWMDAALAHAVDKRPANRTEALSELTENLRRPNPGLGYDRPRPLLERNPLAVWRALAIAALVINVIVLVLLVHRR